MFSYSRWLPDSGYIRGASPLYSSSSIAKAMDEELYKEFILSSIPISQLSSGNGCFMLQTCIRLPYTVPPAGALSASRSGNSHCPPSVQPRCHMAFLQPCWNNKELLAMGVEHFQRVKAVSLASDYGSKDCVNSSSSTAVFRIIVLLSLFFLFFTSCSEESTLQKSWEKANHLSEEEENYAEAETIYNKIAELMEKNPFIYDPSLYVDRGHLFLSTARHSEALADFDKALSSNNLNKESKYKAVFGRRLANAVLGNDEEYKKDFDLCLELNPNPWQIEYVGDEIIIKNIQDNEFQREMIRFFYVNYGVCDKEDIHFDSIGNCTIKCKKNCSNNCENTRK